MTNGGFGETNSGIESTQISRLHLFERFNYPAMALTTSWFPGLHAYMQDLGLRESEVLNIFDYFTGANDQSVTPTKMTDLKIPADLALVKESSDDKHWMFSKNNQIRMEVWAEKTNPIQVGSVYFRNTNGRVTHSETYDARGFMSVATYFDSSNNKLIADKRFFYSPDGREKVQLHYGSSITQDTEATGVKLFDYHGQDYWFHTEKEFRRFFFDEINLLHGSNNTFIVDRGLLAAWPVMNMLTPAYKTMYLHSAHISDFNQPDSLLLNYNYNYGFQNFEKWTNIIASTHYQVSEVLRRFGDRNNKVYCVPVGVLEDEVTQAKHVPMSEREQHSVLTLSRLDNQKSVDLQIKAVAKALEKIPDIQMHIYGEGFTKPQLIQLAKDLKISDHVTFHGWTHDVKSAYLKYQIYLSTSVTEAFGMSMLEALSYGLPLMTTNVESAPELVENGKNGFILPNANEERDQVSDAITRHLLELFSDDKKLQQFSDAAYQHSLSFDAKHVWGKWRQWRDDVKKK